MSLKDKAFREHEIDILRNKYRILDVHEVAGILDVSLPTARKMMREDNFPLIILRKKMCVYEPAFDEWLRNIAWRKYSNEQ